MAILILLAALILLGVLANRYGYDSRDRLRSDDEVRAAAGFRWEPDLASGARAGELVVDGGVRGGRRRHSPRARRGRQRQPRTGRGPAGVLGQPTAPAVKTHRRAGT